MDTQCAQNYLLDLGRNLREMAIEAKNRKISSEGTENEDFATGYLCGFHRVLSLMQQQAEAFQIECSSIGLDNIDPDKDLV